MVITSLYKKNTFAIKVKTFFQMCYRSDTNKAGPRVYLPKVAVLPGSDASSDGVKPASSFVIQNRQTSCSMLCSISCSVVPHSRFGERARFHLCMEKWNPPTPSSD